MQQSPAPLNEARHFRALEIHLAIERHEQLYGLQLLVLCGKLKALMHKLVGEVFDGVSEDFQRAAGLRRDVAAAVGAHTSSGNGLRGCWDRETGSCGSSHAFILPLLLTPHRSPLYCPPYLATQ